VIFNLFRRAAANLGSTREFTGPPDKRLYAVGDVHGRLDLLDALLDKIMTDIRDRPR
jgi:serine/threonine protein phosphatase 1